MSIALDRGGGERLEGVCGGGCMRGGLPPCAASFESPGIVGAGGDRTVKKGDKQRQREAGLGGNSCSSSSSSSIGKNSDLSEHSSDCVNDSCEAEVQSSLKGPLDALDALEEALPMRRGISRFYNGKSKSFTSLADAASSSNIDEIAKPENAHHRKRKNLLAHTLGWDKSNSFPSGSNGRGISKRQIHTSCKPLALAAAMSNRRLENCNDSVSSSNSNNSVWLPPLPPLHPHRRPLHDSALASSPPPRLDFASGRSFSWAYLQHCATVASSDASTYSDFPPPPPPS